MEQLEQAITDSFRQMVDGGKIKAIIDAEIAKTVQETLHSALKPWSDFGKQVEKVIKERLAVDVTQLDLPSYNQTILAIIKNKLEAATDALGREQLSRDMDALLSGHTEKELKFSTLIQEFAEWARAEDYRFDVGERVTCHVDDESYGYRHIYLDPEEDKEKYRCQFSLMLNKDGEICNAKIDGADPSKAIFLGGLSGFPRVLFRMYAAKSRIVLDTLNPDIEVPREECEC